MAGRKGKAKGKARDLVDERAKPASERKANRKVNRGAEQKAPKEPARREGYASEAMGVLTQQLLLAPLEQREAAIPRIEALHDDLELEGKYPLAFIKYRVTGRRLGGGDDLLLIGESLAADLRRMIQELCLSVTLLPAGLAGGPRGALSGALPGGLPGGLPGAAEEDTVEALAGRLNVSTKTVHRWRKQGLRYRWVKPLGARKHRLAFPAAAVAAFDRMYPGRVDFAAKRSWLSAEHKRRLIDRARLLQRETGAGISRISEHLARRTGRAKETIRLILVQHDEAVLAGSSDDVEALANRLVFPERRPPMDEREQRFVERAAGRGIKVGRIAERLNRSRTVVQRLLRKQRLRRVMETRLDYLPGPTFDHADAEVIYQAAPASDGQQVIRLVASTAGLPDPVASWFAVPGSASGSRSGPGSEGDSGGGGGGPSGGGLDAVVVRGWIVRGHYGMYAADRARRRAARSDPLAAEMAAFERWYAWGGVCRSRAARLLLPVVLSVCRQQLNAPPVLEAGAIDQRLVRLLLAGHPVLYDAMAEYDPFFRGRSREVTVVAQLRNRLTRFFAQQPPESEAGRATRRMTAEQIERELIRQAAERGVRLSGDL